MKSKLTYRIKPTADMCQFHGINEKTQFETRFVDGEIVVSVVDEEAIKNQVIANMEKIANDCLDCAFFCETCGRCSLSDDDVEEVPCRCKGCPDLCKEKGVCMRGEDI